MKTIKALSFILVLAAVLISPIPSRAQKTIEKVLANREFKIADFASLEIDHKYGQVICKNHDINVIKVNVTARLETKDPANADKLFSRIELQITGDASKVKIKSEFSNKILSKDENMSVDIEIFMPENINLTLEHMFGNAVIGNLTGLASLNSGYGSLKVGNLQNAKNDIKVSFGNGTIGVINGGKVKVSYGVLTVESAENIQINSEYSTVKVTSAGSLLVQNEGGNFKAGKLESLELSSKFGDAEISDLSKTVLARNEYGSLKINNIESEFTSVELDNSFGSALLTFAREASFAFEARMSFCDLSYPEKSANMSEKVTTAYQSSYKGKFGAAGSDAKAIIQSSYGNVEIKINK